jgi:Leucine-rich repeat (LRR) protein
MRHFPGLQCLHLGHNQLVRLEDGCLDSTTNLTTFDLSNNELASLPATLLSSLPLLSSLSLTNNSLPALPVQGSQLQKLNLACNRLTSGDIKPSLLAGLTGLVELNLGNNLLEELEEQLLANLSSLSLLDLSRNRLLALPQTLRFLRNLKSIDLSGNYITNLESPPALPQLWRLNLSGNKITNVSSASLAGMADLQILDLSNNLVTAIERAAFDANTQLRAVQLDQNQLTKMDSLFHQLPSLTWLNVSDNRIEVFDYTIVPRNLL